MAYASKTEVSVPKTRAEIEALLTKYKARQYGIAVDEDEHTARVQFRLQDRIVRFSLALPDPKKFRAEAPRAQAERSRWRALLLVIRAKLESVELGVETFEHAFIGQIVMPNDQTVADLVVPRIAEAYQTGRMPLALMPATEHP